LKRVSLVAATLPAAAGLMLPAVTASPAAAATAKSHQRSPVGKTVSLRHVKSAVYGHPLINSAHECSGAVCLEVVGSKNDIQSASVSIYHASNHQETLYLGYRTPNSGDNSTWKKETLVWGPGSDGHNWHPQCSLPNDAKVSGYGFWHKASTVTATIEGTQYTAKHPCV
jgi:hypothetical protein